MCVVGLVDSLYLLWEKISQNQALCLPGLGDCWTVNNSKYSELFGIPVALLGAASYLAILVVLLLENKSSFFRNFSSLAVFGMSLVGTLFSAYLTYLELFVINAICPFCVVSAVVMLAVLILTSVRLLRSEL
ncbi:MAG: vitamin K epoxide reductase family protein [Anaerolineaceae bacterium]